METRVQPSLAVNLRQARERAEAAAGWLRHAEDGDCDLELARRAALSLLCQALDYLVGDAA